MGDEALDTTTLFAANTLILWVMAVALAVAGWGRSHEPYWRSWVVANVVLGAALAVFIFEPGLPPVLIAILPNALLVLGMSLRWRAAREFSGRNASIWLVWGPVLVFMACVAPFANSSYALAFTLANLVLAVLAGAVAWEFWRDRADGLPSRYALVAAYVLMGASFGWRIGLGLSDGGDMPHHLPLDLALQVHLVVAVVHTVASGAFALSLAYERGSAELRHAASHDALTGLLNRGAFESGLRDALANDKAGPFTLALFDLDHFKQVNDRYGHAAGDDALRHCATVCLTNIREGDAVARVGGEEFAIVLKNADTQAAAAIVERIRGAVADTIIHSNGQRFRVTISGGICHCPDGRSDFDELMRLADAGLYAAKHKGRNRIERMAA